MELGSDHGIYKISLSGVKGDLIGTGMCTRCRPYFFSSNTADFFPALGTKERRQNARNIIVLFVLLYIHFIAINPQWSSTLKSLTWRKNQIGKFGNQF